MTTLVQSARPAGMQPGRRNGLAADALIVGAVGFLLSVAFSWLPSLWYDEAATVVSATRSWPELWRMLENVDAVHGLFYAGMHVWFDLVGYSPFTLRLPSAIATGLAAGLIVVLVRQLAPRRTALLAGVLFCLLPRVTWMGAEGRSYALSTALAVVLTLVFLAAARRARADRRVQAAWWALYGVLAVLITVVFLYLALLVAAHGVTAVWTRYAPRGGESKAARLGTAHGGTALLGWLLASVGAAAAVVPFVRAVVGQVEQVSWIDPIGWVTLHSVFVAQWFNLNPVFAALGWLLIGAGIALLVRTELRGRRSGSTNTARAPWEGSPAGISRPDRRTAAEPRRGEPTLLAVALPWLVVPTLGLVVASLLISPLYSPRYLSYGAPAAAILMAVAVAALHSRLRMVIALALCALLAAGPYVQQRLPESKQETSWSEVADLVARERAREPAGTTGAIVYGPVRQHPSATTRVIAYSYPTAFAGLVDLKLRTPAAQTGELWETRYPLAGVTERFDGVDVVWLVTSDKQDWRPSVTSTLGTLGYSLRTEWGLTGVNVLRYAK